MDSKLHWEQIYRTKRPDQVSWFEAEPRHSLDLVQRVAPGPDAAIIDVGAGAATFVDGLLDAGYRRITVLDLSAVALAESQRRLGERARLVDWREADVRTARFAPHTLDVWHDRAVFHFLTEPADRSSYVAQVRHALRPGGFVLVATFAADGPARCSGLEVDRYSADELHTEFGRDFRLLTSERHMHVTPRGAQQAFTYCLCQYEPHAFTRHAA